MNLLENEGLGKNLCGKKISDFLNNIEIIFNIITTALQNLLTDLLFDFYQTSFAIYFVLAQLVISASTSENF